MHFGLAFIAALASSALAIPTKRKGKSFSQVHPGGIDDITITKYNTLNGTHVPGGKSSKPSTKASATLPLSFQNNFSGGSVTAYITGTDSSNAVAFINSAGEFVYPSAGGSTTPVAITDDIAIPLSAQGGSIDVTIPDYLSSGRIYFAEGNLTFFMIASDVGDTLVQPDFVNLEDPNAGVNWGFVELTNNDTGLYANISYVDFVGMILGMSLTGSNGTATVPGLAEGSLTNICSDLASQSDSDGQAWSELCQIDEAGNPLRALAPVHYTAAFEDYWTEYADTVWSTYTDKALNIVTQNDDGTVSCQVSDDTLSCPNDSSTYPKPTSDDIWGCNSGTFAQGSGDNGVHLAVVARVCAAFNRGTLLQDGGDTQPALSADHYYTTDPCNHYSAIVHDYEVDGIGYAFSFDDVAPEGENPSGELTSPDPQLLTIYVGAPPST